jgi:DNA topoisomerase-1
MTWDVPVDDKCPECGLSLFKKSERSKRAPYCINEACPAFVPEDQRGGYKKKTDADEGEKSSNAAAKAGSTKKTKKAATPKKTATKKPAAKKAAANE